MTSKVSAFDDDESGEDYKYDSVPKDRANDENRRPHINYLTYKTLTERRVKPGDIRIDGRRAGEWDPER